MKLTQEDLKTLIEQQLQTWPMAKRNYDALCGCRRKRFALGDLEGAVQFNPARMASTGADVSAKGVASRKCFLCASNRPEEQVSVDIEPGWELLVNPFPIFPMHFTIAAKTHSPQQRVPPEIISIAEKMEHMTVFYNGSKAGASAPDHAHLQAVLTEELPLMRLIERSHDISKPGIFRAAQLGLELPFEVISALIAPDENGLKSMARMLAVDGELMNFFAFIGADSYLRMVAVGRSCHRPDCYFAEGSEKLLVSPGSVDMAGVIITPREDDFNKITPGDIDRIYRQTGVAAHVAP